MSTIKTSLRLVLSCLFGYEFTDLRKREPNLSKERVQRGLGKGRVKWGTFRGGEI